MKELEIVIDQKEKEVEKLRKEIEALENARSILQNIGPTLPSHQHRVTRKIPSGKRARRRFKISIPDAAEQVLKETGPLHVSQLTEKMVVKGVKTTPVNVTTSLQRYIKLGRRFERTAPGTFGVV